MEVQQQPTTRDKIIMVLKESLKLAKQSEFVYEDIYEKHKVLPMIERLDSTIKEKIEIFSSLDEKSYTFERMLDTAKMCLRPLQSGKGYNYYAAELILQFHQLEDFFKGRKLKSVGVRFESKEPTTREFSIPVKEFTSSQQNDKDFVATPGMDGKDLVKRQRELQVLKEARFDE